MKKNVILEAKPIGDIKGVFNIPAYQRGYRWGIKQVDKATEGKLLIKRPEIPWKDVIGIRNHIAHGYFDIDGEMVLDVVKNDLDTLLAAIEFFINKSA